MEINMQHWKKLLLKYKKKKNIDSKMKSIRSTISKALSGERKSAYGYRWSYD